MARSFMGSSRNVQGTVGGVSGGFSQYRYLIAGVGVVVLLFVIISSVGSTKSESTGSVEVVTSDELAGPIATAEVNREFSVPLKDSQGEEVSKLTFRLQEAEKRDEIIVKGQKAEAINDRVFLILNFKIDNTFDKAVDINTRDYFRLMANGDESEKYAANIHNDPKTVQAISTEPSRVGFAINESDTNLILEVGDIGENKQRIELVFN